MSAAAAAPAPAPAVRDIRDPTRVVKYNLTRKVDDIGYDWLGAVSMILSMGGSYLKVNYDQRSEFDDVLHDDSYALRCNQYLESV